MSISEFQTIVDILRWRAVDHENHLALTFLPNGEPSREISLTFGELDQKALAISRQLLQNVDRGERALLLFPPGLDFVAALLGCFYSGVVAVPAYPPHRRRVQVLEAIAHDAQPGLILTSAKSVSDLRHHFSELDALSSLNLMTVDNDAPCSRSSMTALQPRSNDLALLQYTSGSTSAPKGVMLTHGNLMKNNAMMKSAFGHTEKTIYVSWLPLYHDMGLIGHLLHPLYMGIPTVLMPPVAFLQRPFRWLAAISRYKATVSGGPNFAYDLCTDRISPSQCAGLDLSSWEVTIKVSIKGSTH